MRVVTHRRVKINLKMRAAAEEMLAAAQKLLDDSRGLDTQPRDILSEGLARIVYVAYDTSAIAECISDYDSIAYIQQKTYLWFRERGFAEWFCVACSTLFQTSQREFFRNKVTVSTKKKVTRIKREKVA